MNELHMVIVLAALNLVQLIFWSFQVHTLVNKLMCRDLTEYSLVKRGPPKSKTINLVDDDETQDPAGELNGMFGFKGVS